MVGSVGRNSGRCRACVACSNPLASLMSVGSLYAVPMNVSPTGRPNASPAGTLINGYPAIAAGPELAPRKWSPLTRSVVQAGDPVGATIASRSCWASTASIPSRPPRLRWAASAARYSASVYGSDSASSNHSWRNHFSSTSAFASLNAIASASESMGTPVRVAR